MLTLMQGDCLEKLKTIPDGTVDLALTDPPYNVGVTTQRQGTKTVNAWDKIDHYIDWCIQWLLECQRVLKTNGVLYFWHNDMPQIAQLLEAIREKTTLSFVSFCIWDKGEAYRARSWKNRDPNGKTALRSWFNVCEFCLHFFNTPKGAQAGWKQTGWERVNSDPVCYRPLKDWYKREKERLGITDREVGGAVCPGHGEEAPYALPLLPGPAVRHPHPGGVRKGVPASGLCVPGRKWPRVRRLERRVPRPAGGL